MAFYVGDIPAEDLVIEPARGEEPIDLAPFTTDDSTVVLRDFEGNVIPADFLLDFEEGSVVLEWPTDASPFPVGGLYTLTITLAGPTARERLAPFYFVAQVEDGWHTIDSVRGEWVTGAPSLDRRLFQLLELAKQQVVAFAPSLAEGQQVPMNYREGQLMQARNLWNAGRVDPQSGGMGDEDFVIRPYPLDWMVKQVLRPRTGVPVVG